MKIFRISVIGAALATALAGLTACDPDSGIPSGVSVGVGGGLTIEGIFHGEAVGGALEGDNSMSVYIHGDTLMAVGGIPGARRLYSATFEQVPSGTFEITAQSYNSIALNAAGDDSGFYTRGALGTLQGGPTAGTTTSGLSMRMEISGLNPDTANLEFDPRYDRTPVPGGPIIAGTWTDERDFLSLTFEEDATFTGQDADGCVYEGVITVAEGGKNFYDLSATLSGTEAQCGPFAGPYTGISALIRTIDRTLFIGATKDSALRDEAFAFELNKVVATPAPGDDEDEELP